MAATPEQRSSAPQAERTITSREGLRSSPENVEIEPVQSVASMRRFLESSASVPIFPQYDSSFVKKAPTDSSSSQPPIRETQGGKISSPDGLHTKSNRSSENRARSIFPKDKNHRTSRSGTPQQKSATGKDVKDESIAKSREQGEVSRRSPEVNGNEPVQSETRRQQASKASTSVPFFSQNGNQRSSMAATPEQRSSAPQAERTITSREGLRSSPENVEIEPVQSVASMRRFLESSASVPIFPQYDSSFVKKAPTDSSSSQPPIRETQGGKISSPTKSNRYSENPAKPEPIRPSTPARSVHSTRSGKKKHSGRQKKKVTPEEEMRNLSIECVGLSKKMKSVPKFSPEWKLSKVEMKLITDELKFLYKESLARGAPV